MKLAKYIVPILIIILGTLFFSYGIKTAQISNRNEIYKENNCEHYLKINQYTQNNPDLNHVCYSLEKSSSAKKDYGNRFVYSGSALIISGACLATINIINNKKNSSKK